MRVPDSTFPNVILSQKGGRESVSSSTKCRSARNRGLVWRKVVLPSRLEGSPSLFNWPGVLRSGLALFSYPVASL